MAALAAVSTAFFTTLHRSKAATSCFTSSTRHRVRTIITSALSSSTSTTTTTTTTTTEFNITFAPPKDHQPVGTSSPNSDRDDDSSADELGGQLYIPWIVRDENGNLKLQSTPPAPLLHAMANADTGKKKNKLKDKEKGSKAKPTASSSAEPPKLSKAARRFYNENFRDPPQRLNKVLAAAGVASRRSSDELIFGGKVTVNGSVCNTPQTRVDPLRDAIYVNGNRLPKKLPPRVYFALNKPKGYICAAGEKETKSVLSLFDDFFKSWDKRNPGQPKPRLFTVGRLDVATTGLIIVTNDGDFAQQLSHPSSNLSKEYIATIDGAVYKKQLIAISEGTVVEGVRCTPDVVELLPQQPDISRPRIRIVVHQGRNHEVRELVKNAGLEVHALKRVRIGGFRLPSDLALGKHIELKPANLRTMGWKS